MKNLHTRKTSNGSNSDWLIRQMSINQKSGRQTFRRSIRLSFRYALPAGMLLQSETKIEPDLRLALKLTDLWITSLLFDLNYNFINWSFAFSPG